MKKPLLFVIENARILGNNQLVFVVANSYDEAIEKYTDEKVAQRLVNGLLDDDGDIVKPYPEPENVRVVSRSNFIL